MMKLCAALRNALAFGVFVIIAFAQGPAFDVSSVKRNDSGVRRYAMNPSGDRFTATNVTLLRLMMFAYDVQSFQIAGGPAWLATDRFDIEAKASGRLSKEQSRPMLQSLFAERFLLKLHKETRQQPVYELVVAKGGARIKESKCVGVPSPANPCGAFSGSERGQLTGREASMEAFALALSPILGRAVIDRTKLGGKYDFDLSWTPDDAEQGPGDPDAPPADRSGPSIFTAVQERLGLKLESAKGPVQVLVVDQVKSPTAN